ncbi:MAG: hypothetical protein HKN79_05930, partial [Flavobacteriales bacterium]|nr:hypothetical protein [Flavobacteriales bacterium]
MAYCRGIRAFRTALLLLGALFVLPTQGQFYNGSNQEFGKNRIQYREFLWQYYRFDRYDTYFYEGGEDLAAYISEIAPTHIQDIQNKLDFVIDDRIEFIVYNTQSDFRQSNLGLVKEEESAQIGGSAQIVGTKVFVYFEGDHEQLEQNLREGLARMMIQNMLYGGDWKDVVKNSALLNLPNWYTEGLVSYLVDDWTPEIRDRVADGVRYNRYSHFNRISDLEAVYAGFSIWRYIADVYGPSVIPNILYMTRLSRNLESGFIFVIGVPLERLLEEHHIYYSNYFNQKGLGRDDPPFETIRVKTKPQRIYSQFKISPTGSQAAYVSNELGQYRIHLLDLDEYRKEEAERREVYERKKKEFEQKEIQKAKQDSDYIARSYPVYTPAKVRGKRIFKAEHKLERKIDESYPILEWNPQGTELAFITEKKGRLWLNIYSLDKKKNYPRELFGLDKVISFDYASTGTQMVFSGVREGQTDIYRYYLVGNRQEQLTNDPYDDLDPRFVRDDSKVIFASTRTNDTLDDYYMEQETQLLKDIFVLDLNDRDVLERITDTPERDERSPFEYDSIRYTFLAEKDLIYDRYVAEYDSAISRIDTVIHYRYFTRVERLTRLENNPIGFHLNASGENYSFFNFRDGRYRFYIGDSKQDGAFGTLSGPGSSSEDLGVISDEESTELPGLEVLFEEPYQHRGVDIFDYQFRDESAQTVPDDEEGIPDTGPVIIDDIDEIIALQASPEDTTILVIPKARNYRLNFAVDQADLDITNSFQLEFYQDYRTNDQNLSPGFTPALQWGLSDLFEDRRLVGAIGFLGGISDLSYGVQYDNLTKRLDKSVIFQRQTTSYTVSTGALPLFVKSQSHVLRYQMSYPFNEVFSLRGDLFGSYKRDIVRVVDDVSLRLPNQHRYLGGGRVQLVFDNTLSKGLNLLNGSRAKVWTEYYRRLDFEGNEYPDFGVIGLDLRHYQKIHRDLIAAFRIAGNTSFGQERLISFLGGVDNWVIPSPRYDNTVSVDASQNYAYQALIMPMRGFYRNARNGTSSAVVNAEIRFPVFKYFFNRPIQSDFIENFQIVGFGDVGSAWTGSGPYAENNTFNTDQVEISNIPSVTFILQNQEDPLLAGY